MTTERTALLEPFLEPLSGFEETLRSILEPVLFGLGFELIQLHLVRGAHRDQVRLFVDRRGATGTKGRGISMADLEILNRTLGDLLDVEDNEQKLFRAAWELEVSSPGLDRPLTKRSHFAAAIGSRVKVKSRLPIAGTRTHLGTLQAADDDGVDVQSDGAESSTRVPFGEVTSAHVVFVFSEATRPEPKRKKKAAQGR